jgi:E3 ubiquitin-protein ligase RAD18
LPLDTAMEQLPDSTDWISTSLPAFEPLEAALRCEICKEFYENPVITTCSHTFCSLCIRRCISHDSKCPACRSVCQADKLVANVVVREIVGRFQDVRPKALALAQRSDEFTLSRGSRKRKHDDAEIEEGGSQRITRTRSARTSSQRGSGMSDSPLEVADSGDEGDADFVPDEIPAGMVACPQCNVHMKEELVWAHIGPAGNCPGELKAAGQRNSRIR